MADIKVTVRELTAGEDAAWNELVLSSHQKTICLSTDFQKMWVEADPSLHMLRLGCFDDQGRLIGGQAFYHRKVLGFRLQYLPNIAYTNTPILSGLLQNNGRGKYIVLSALSNASRKYFPYQRVECDPSLTDVRPFLEHGWRAAPKYSHIWDIRDPEAILRRMHRKRRYVRNALENMLFARESGEAILTDFLRLYRETMKKFDWQPARAWEEAFRKRMEWLEARDCVRLYTCRMKTGDLVCAAVFLLSRPSQTVYSWLIGYDHTLNSKEFPPAINWYAARDLCAEFSYLEFFEGNELSLYAFKDSLGTYSAPYFVLKTQNADQLLHYYYKARKAIRHISGIFQRLR